MHMCKLALSSQGNPLVCEATALASETICMYQMLDSRAHIPSSDVFEFDALVVRIGPKSE